MTSRTRLRALLVSALGVGLALGSLTAPATSASADSTTDPRFRTTTSPQVFYPLVGSRAVVDRENWTRTRGFTDISAPCGAAVRATHAGTAQVLDRRVKGKRMKVVRVTTGAGKLWTGSAYLSSAAVKHGQTVTSGQRIGTLGKVGRARTCKLQFKVATGSRTTNPSVWLDRYVGTLQTAPVSTPAPPAPPAPAPPTPTPAPRPPTVVSDLTLVSFNILGGDHTANNKRPGFATYPSRFDRTMALLDEREVDVAGIQEMHKVQAEYFASKGFGKTWGMYHYVNGTRVDTQNPVLWRKSTMELVKAETFTIPYFYGQMKHMPAVLLREKASGRTAWYLNIHNPAQSADRAGDESVWRAQALEIERAKVEQLRRDTNRPVFLVGDFNDNAQPVCALTLGRLMVSPFNPVFTDECQVITRFHSIDWIFGTAGIRWNSYLRDLMPKDTKISDHPMIQAEVALQG